MYGAQTGSLLCRLPFLFENDVEMYGAQTQQGLLKQSHCLRMM